MASLVHLPSRAQLLSPTSFTATAPPAQHADIKVHPLVVMSVADHYTRDQIQIRRERVIGTLFGTQSGREVNILETFEIAWKVGKDGKIQVEQGAFEEDMKLCSLFPISIVAHTRLTLPNLFLPPTPLP